MVVEATTVVVEATVVVVAAPRPVLVVVGARVVVGAGAVVAAGAVVVGVRAVVVGLGGAVVDVEVVGLVGSSCAAAGPTVAIHARAEARSRRRRTGNDGIGSVAESSVNTMEPTDLGSEGEEPTVTDGPARPWAPGLPAPGTRVAGYGGERDETNTLKASTASELYESARFPELGEVAPPGSPGAKERGPGAEQGAGQETGGLRILGLPAPKEIAGPVLAALALAVALLGWRRRRRRRRG